MLADRLPIYDSEGEILSALRQTRRLVLSAPTGSGKSTQVPQMLLRHGLLGDGQVIILQPRRIAARMLAARVAQELGVKLGEEVGYTIRFENASGPKTRIRYVTEGVLLRQLIDDPSLPGISALIFDEFHERHLYGDITLARALDVQESTRADLKLVVMSATLDADRLLDYLHPAAWVTSEGRMFPVQTRYAATPSYMEKRPVWEQAAEAFGDWVNQGGRGDALVFMPGSFEIAQTLDAIRRQPESKGYILLPLHGELPPADQDTAVARHSQPKVVVSTNVAETSLTIDGVRVVIDSGLARLPRYDPFRGINTLLIERISQASAEQRAGRAGRTAPGICVRLWTEREHQERAARELPEVKRLDLSEVVLALKSAGITDLQRFRWLEAPDPRSLADAEELLHDLGALDKAGAITPVGRKMLAFPIHPRYARMLLAAADYNCVYQAALVAALTQGRDILLRNVDRDTAHFRDDLFGEKGSSDFWLLMRAWQYAANNGFRLDACRKAGIHMITARQVGPLLDHFLRIARREGLDVEPRPVPDEPLQKCVLIGFSDRVARRADAGTLRCDLVHGRKGVLARESVVQHSPILVTAEIREVEGKDKTVNTILSMATEVKSEWLQELFPEDISRQLRVFYDPTQRRVQAEEQLKFRDLPLDARRVDPPPADAAARLLAERVIAGELVLKEWDHSVDQWILRLNLLSAWCPDLQLPPITEDDRRLLIEQLCHGAFGYKDIKDRPVKNVVKSWLSPAQQDMLDKYAPERIEMPTGRSPKVTYEPNATPYISARIQELFGVTQTPRIAMGRVTVLVHILAPSMRPVQITQDLAGFWREHYPRIKQELQRKYPKHEWR